MTMTIDEQNEQMRKDVAALPSPEEVLENPELILADPRGFMITSVLGRVLLIVRDESTPEKWEALRDIIEHVYLNIGYDNSVLQAESMWGIVQSLKPAGYTERERTGPWKMMKDDPSLHTGDDE